MLDVIVAAGSQPGKPALSDGAAKLAEAIGDMWLTLAVLLIGGIAWYLRREIKKFLNDAHSLRFSKGENSVELQRQPQVAKVEASGDLVGTQSPQPEKEEAPVPNGEAEEFEPINKMVIALSRRELDVAEAAYEELQRDEHDEKERKENEAIYLTHKFNYTGDRTAMDRLEELAKDPVVAAKVEVWIGFALRLASEFESALPHYQRALTLVTTDTGRVGAVAGICLCYADLGRTDEAVALVAETLAKITDAEAKVSLYQALAVVFEKAKEERLRSIALEKVVELEPGNAEARFSAAYSQSNVGFRDAALNNYQEALGFDAGDHYARNNLGALYSALELPIIAVSCYKKAAEGGNSLSMGNIAFLYLDAGFESEAKRIVGDAQQHGHEHARLAAVASALTSRRSDENERAAQIKAEGERKTRFLRAFADAFFVKQDSPHLVFEGWILKPNTQVAVSLDGAAFGATWTRGNSTHKMSGLLTNRGLRVTYNIEAPWNEFLAERGSRDGFGYFSPDGNRLFVMTADEKKTEYLEITRKLSSGNS